MDDEEAEHGGDEEAEHGGEDRDQVGIDIRLGSAELAETKGPQRISNGTATYAKADQGDDVAADIGEGRKWMSFTTRWVGLPVPAFAFGAR